MQFHVRPLESRPPASAFDDAGVAPVIAITQFTAPVRASFAPDQAHHPEYGALLADEQANGAGDDRDCWSMLDEYYREHMARCALEELFATGEMWSLEY